MRQTFLVIALVACAFARADDAKQAAPNGAESCLECHNGSDAPAVDGAAFAKSVHGENGIACADCHAGYSMGPHEEELPALSAEEQGLVARLQKGRWGEGDEAERITAPRAFLACSGCHSEVTDAIAKSIHGRWLREERPVAGPTCVSCHGPVHAIAKLAPYEPRARARQKVPADRRAMVSRCERCHGNEEFAKAAGLNPEAVITYNDSIHGRLVRIGNELAPACTSCHASSKDQGGTHAIVAKTDPASPVNPSQRKDTCGRCHEGASDNFAALIAHKPIQETGGHIGPHITHVAFSWLTTLTLLFFAFHVAVDFVYELRMRLSRRHTIENGDDLKSVVRFDIHQRFQHWFMLSGVILLAITGWPLRGAGAAEAAPYSRAFLGMFGGAEGAAIWHRVGAILIIISSIYHAVYLTFLASKKRLPLSMAPTLKDAFDIRDNVLFMLGVRKERPKFDRFMYLEKFDYWAIFWGIPMMVGSGLVYWFPTFFATWAPSWLLTATFIIHGEEATLAVVFLFVVHFYNVHLKPSIFPMNWAWLNGRITVDALKHEHPLEYERIKSHIDG